MPALGGRVSVLLVATVAVLACASAPSAAAPGDLPPVPAADHHMHLQSARVAGVLVQLKEHYKELVEPSDRAVVGAADAVAALDAAGIAKGVVLSGAYLIGSPAAAVEREADEVRAENAWTAAQSRLYPSRLVGFCSVNPLKPYAEAEIDRCASDGLRGLKMHFTNSAVDLRDPAHVERLRAVLGRANSRHLALLLHVRTRRKDYGATDARAFVDHVLPAAPDVPVTVAHMAGWGGYDRATDKALGAIVAACAHSSACSHLAFDLAYTVLPASASSAPPGTSMRTLADAQRGFNGANRRLAERIRAIGTNRILFASDWPGMTPLEERDAIRALLPVTASQLRTIFANEAPYLR
jgi:uncharacterized protein